VAGLLQLRGHAETLPAEEDAHQGAGWQFRSGVIQSVALGPLTRGNPMCGHPECRSACPRTSCRRTPCGRTPRPLRGGSLQAAGKLGLSVSEDRDANSLPGTRSSIRRIVSVAWAITTSPVILAERWERRIAEGFRKWRSQDALCGQVGRRCCQKSHGWDRGGGRGLLGSVRLPCRHRASSPSLPGWVLHGGPSGEPCCWFKQMFEPAAWLPFPSPSTGTARRRWTSSADRDLGTCSVRQVVPGEYGRYLAATG
jgi:hypothetical protein